MAQPMVWWFICGGRLQVRAVNAIGWRKDRIIDVEDLDSGERFRGSPNCTQRPSIASSGSAAPLATMLLGSDESGSNADLAVRKPSGIRRIQQLDGLIR